MRTQIFHLDLTGMSLGKTVAKLTHAIKASSTLCCVHLSMNNVPLEIVYDMDKELGVPESRGNKINRFRPLEEKRSAYETETYVNTSNQMTHENSKQAAKEDEDPAETPEEKKEIKNEETSLKEDLINELKRLQLERSKKDGKDINMIDADLL